MVATDLVRLGVRDQDTSVDVDSLYAALLYAPVTYRAEYVPEEDPIFQLEEVEQSFISFNDTSYELDLNNPSTTSVLTVGGEPVYRIVRGADAGEGFLYFTAPITSASPIGMACRVSISALVLGGSYSYVTWGDFTGVMLGFLHWPRTTGLFLWFRDDTVTKRITITGPALDDAGTRVEYATVAFDWSSEDSFTYRILWDETQGRDVMAVSVLGASSETLLYSGTITGIDSFLDGVKVGQDHEEAERAGLIVGIDAPETDSIDVYKAALYTFGGVALRSGLPTVRSTSTVQSDESIPLDADRWTVAGEGIFDGEAFTRTDGEAGSLLAARDEPALFQREWVVYAKFHAEVGQHPGTYDTGMGIVVEDGASVLSLRLYDDFDTHTLGFLHGDADVDTDYAFPVDDVEWENSTTVALVGSGVRNLVRTWMNGVLGTEFSYDPGDYPASTERRLSVGFIPEGHSGTLTFEYLWLLPRALCFEGIDATFPEAQGWVRSSALATRSWSTPSLLVDARAAGAYDIYTAEAAVLEALSGAVIVGEITVSGWESSGRVNAPNVQVGPVAMAAYSRTKGAYLCCAVAENGRMYVYIPTSDLAASLTAVLRQTVAGRARSAELDFTQKHTYMLRVSPLNHVRLYVDFELVIDIPWSTTEGFDLPAHGLAAQAYAAFGALQEGVSLSIGNARAAFGRGYDLGLGLSLTEDQLQQYVYGSDVATYLDFEDT